MPPIVLQSDTGGLASVAFSPDGKRLAAGGDGKVQFWPTTSALAAASRLGLFLRWIEASALVVSGLGMLGITWIAVKERTREFGTRRALGASAFDVFLHVISESTVLALAGCLAGASLSWPISRFISQTAGLTFVFSNSAVLVAFVAAAVLNIGFAVWPSRRAATLDPIAALRYE